MEQDVSRKCIVSGEVKDKSDLLRFVVLEGHLVPDFQKKLKGKGLYVTNSRKILQTAADKKLFTKAARRNLPEEAQICEITANILRKRGVDFINLARKAGLAVIGFEKVKESLKNKKAEFVVEAADSGADGRKKLSALLENVPVFEFYDVDELDDGLKKVNTAYIAFLKGPISTSALYEFKRIKSFFAEN